MENNNSNEVQPMTQEALKALEIEKFGNENEFNQLIASDILKTHRRLLLHAILAQLQPDTSMHIMD